MLGQYRFTEKGYEIFKKYYILKEPAAKETVYWKDFTLWDTARAGEPANFFSGSGSSFCQEAPAPIFFLSDSGSGDKNMQLRLFDYLLSLVKYFFPY